MISNLPNCIFTGEFHGGHIQGIAVDEAGGFIYCSFTTELIKIDFKGNLIGSVVNLIGHLGCIAYDKSTDRVLGSLELKHDVIGSGIIRHTGKELAGEDCFYAVSFDAKRIDRLGIDAETSGIMKAVYLRDVCDDYSSIDEASGKDHRYGCSGFDGITLFPGFGADGNKCDKLLISYGIYSDIERSDNDYQVLLQYDKSIFDDYGASLIQTEPHHSGPAMSEAKYFLYTGNTTFGIQNLEYDPYSKTIFAAVYNGKKTTFKNFNMYYIAQDKLPEKKALTGRCGEIGEVVSSRHLGQSDVDGIFGCHFPFGSTGMASLGDGYFYFSEPGGRKEERVFYSSIRKYKLDFNREDLFEKAE